VPFDPPVVVVTDRSRFPAAAPGEAFSPEEWRALAAAIAGGPGALQLRDKDLAGGFVYERAERLRELCRRAGVKLLVNDRVDVACAVGADGVQLPAAGIAPADARRLLPAGAIVGRSLHSAAEIPDAAGADFVVYGPVFETPSKRAYGPPQGLDALTGVCRASEIPVVAIGGIDDARAPEVRSAGAAGIAAIAAVLGAPDPAAAVRRLVAAFAA